MDIRLICKAKKHFDFCKTHLDKTGAYHEMKGYVAALFEFGFIDFKELIAWNTELSIWYDLQEVLENDIDRRR